MPRVTSPDGTEIALWRSGAGPPLLLVHGTAADHTRWSQVSPAFAQSFTLYVIDRRGRGESGDAEAYSIGLEGEDVAAVAEWIGEPVNLLGHSYGAICCLEAAWRTNSIRRLVLYEPPIPVDSEIAPTELRRKLEAQVDRETALLTFFREVVRVPESQLQVMRAHPAWPGRVAAVHTVVREVRAQSEYRLNVDRMRAIQTPTLLLLGGDSPAFFRDATRAVASSLPDSRTLELPGQHHVAMDLIPGEFVERVRSFFLV